MNCYYCKCSLTEWGADSDYAPTRDHKIPKSRGGKGSKKNIVIACRRCNYQKGNRTAEEFRAFLRNINPPSGWSSL